MAILRPTMFSPPGSPCISFDCPPVFPIKTAAGKPFSFCLQPRFSFVPNPSTSSISGPLIFVWNLPVRRRTRAPFCSPKDVREELSGSHSSGKSRDDSDRGTGDLELLNKPSPAPVNDLPATELGEEPKKLSEKEALAPFLKFFKTSDSRENTGGGGEPDLVASQGETGSEDDETDIEHDKACGEYYEPNPGDFVLGVVVSGNGNKLDVNIGADLVGTMLTKEILPLYDKEMEYLLCDMEKDAKGFMVGGKTAIVKNGEAMSDDEPVLALHGVPVVETGTVLLAEVLGRTLSGRPLLSSRKLFRKVAWYRVRQMEQLDEPFEVRITEWNTGGLLTRIEGLRAFIPKSDLLARVNNFTELKENVGRQMHVKILKIDEANNDLILSEKEAWGSLHLQEGTLLRGIVKKIFPYGAQIRIGETNRSGLLHVSNISKNRVTSVDDVLAVDEEVKALVVKSLLPGKIFLSTAELESEPGIFISNRERVYAEADEMAKKYRKRLPVRKLQPLTADSLPFRNEATMVLNWRWFKFERDYGST